MELTPGYKQTEVGRLPDDWEVRSLVSLGQVLIGLTYAPSNVSDHGLLVLRSSNIQNGRLHFDSTVYVQMEVPERVITQENDLLICVRNGSRRLIGKCVLIDGATQGAAFGAFMSLFRSDDNLFVVQQFKSKTIARQIGETLGATINQITNKDLHAFQIPYPPRVEEREAIAEALSDADALIESLEQLIAKKRLIKQGVMQELLTGKRRLPGFETKSGLKQTEVGLIPDTWILARLSSLVDPARDIRYGIVQPGKYDPNGRYMIRGQDYSESKGWAQPQDVFRVSPEVECRYQNARVKQGDLIMTIVGYCGHVETVPAWLCGANLTQTTARVAIRDDAAIASYCKYFLQSHLGLSQVSRYVKGAAQPGLNCGDVEQFTVVLPSRVEQAAIADTIESMDLEIDATRNQVTATHQIRQGMMQQLLTGKIRLT